jgi:hypothetical protein
LPGVSTDLPPISGDDDYDDDDLLGLGDSEFEVDEQLEEQWFTEWQEADRRAAELLCEALSDRRGQPPPGAALGLAAAAVRARLAQAGDPFAWIRGVSGLQDEPAPGDDAELLIRCAAGTISPQQDAELELEQAALLVSLERPDWLGAVVGVVRAGAGADASPEGLVAALRDCPEVADQSDLDDDAEASVQTAFSIVSAPWEALELIDADEQLTALGEWVLPRALARAWGADFDRDPGHAGG